MPKTTPPTYSGFVLTFEPERTEWLSERLDEDAEFKESFSAIDWSFERRELVMLVLHVEPYSISAMALMERMHGSGGSGKLKMKMSNMVVFDTPVTEKEIFNSGIHEVTCTPETLERSDVDTWESLVSELKALRPDQAEAIDNIISLRQTERRLLGETPRVARLNEQRDGLGLSLYIANLDRASVMKSINVDKAESAESILDLLDAVPIQERTLLEHDSRIFEQLLGDDSYRSAQFTDGSERSVRVLGNMRLSPCDEIIPVIAL